MKGRRHAERRETLAYWQAQEEGTGEPVALVTDLSEDGICLHSPHRFSKGHQLAVRVAIDPEVAGTDHVILHIENVWCHESGVPGLYHAGFKLLEVSDTARQGLRRLLDTFSYPVPRPP